MGRLLAGVSAEVPSPHTDLLIGPPSDAETPPPTFGAPPHGTAPVLIIHGDDDTVTPVSHARRLTDALDERAILITFPDEAHGLRNPDHVRHALQAELEHYRRTITR